MPPKKNDKKDAGKKDAGKGDKKDAGKAKAKKPVDDEGGSSSGGKVSTPIAHKRISGTDCFSSLKSRIQSRSDTSYVCACTEHGRRSSVQMTSFR